MTLDIVAFDNPVFDDEGATGGTYGPADAWKYRDETNLQQETQLVKMALDDFYKYFEEKCIKPGAIDYNGIELVVEKLRFKGSSIVLIKKALSAYFNKGTTGR